MAFTQRKALGALLVAATISPACAFSEMPKASKTGAATDGTSSRLSKGITKSGQNLVSSTKSANNSITSASEAARARALLDRYYAISADAVASNRSSQDKKAGKDASTEPAVISTPARLRTPAADAFEDIVVKPGSSDPVHKKYVICGGGTAAWSAIEAILKEDPAAASDILLISEESFHPYNRTMLSKEVWKSGSNTSPSAVEYGYKRVIAGGKVPVMRNVTAINLDTKGKIISLSNDVSVHYDKILLATGGLPKPAIDASPAFFAPDMKEFVSVFRGMDDFTRLRDRLAASDRGVIVVGGGFLGTELAIALSSVSKKVSLVVAEAGVLYHSLPRYLCEFLAGKIEGLGVTVARSAVVTDASVTRGGDAGDTVCLRTTSSEAEVVEGGDVVVAIGLEPRSKLAAHAGLETDERNGGVVVNTFMMATPDVFAAGDVASYYDPVLGRRRVEHWDHAVVTGRIAGENMTGKRSAYELQSMFWCDLSNIGVDITAVGRVDSELETIGVWNTAMPCVEHAVSRNEFISGVVYYLNDSEIVGAVLWNARKGSGALRRARALIDAKTMVEGIPMRTLGDMVNVADGSFRMYVRTKPPGCEKL